ncbi:alpha/beta hydrolase [Nocardia sp. NPDC052001]|uniref:alpha/beta fold hydrolase n=1 Tax=Nocardia sp. NPDC052001 TaxID=3154853 RepID=UPI00341B32D1
MRIRILPLTALVALSAVIVSGCGNDDTADAGTSTTIPAAAADRASADGKGHYAQINGGSVYYETQGSGRPMALLHGGLGTAESTFGPYVSELAKTRRVISVELQAHGHTPDRDRPLAYESLADDVSALITHLNLGKADIVGYSLGGSVAMQVAARTPELVSGLVVIGAPFRSDGWRPESRAGMAAMDPEAMRGTPLHQLYTGIAPDPNGWTSLVTKTRELLAQNYDWTARLAEIQAPALVVTAESDVIFREHAADTVTRLNAAHPNLARLEIAQGTTHYDIMYRPDLLLPMLATLPKQ